MTRLYGRGRRKATRITVVPNFTDISQEWVTIRPNQPWRAC